MPRRPPRRFGSGGRGEEGRPGSTSDDDMLDHFMCDGHTPGVAPHPLVTPPSYAVPLALVGQQWGQQQAQAQWAQQQPQEPFDPINHDFFAGVAPGFGVSAPAAGSYQDVGSAPLTGSNFGNLIYQAGLAARPALNQGVQYPFGPPPMTLHNQFQQPVGRSTGSSRQGDEPHVSPPSVHRRASSSSSPSGTDTERTTRGASRPKTKETNDPARRVAIRLVGKKNFEVLSDHDKVKKHGDVISDIGAIMGLNFHGAWYKLPAKDQAVTEDFWLDGGYVWHSYLQSWQETLRHRYTWPREQHEAIVERFTVAFRERLSRMIYAGRYKPNKNGFPCWSTAPQWAEIVRRIKNDAPFLATCDLNQRNRTAQGSYSTHNSGRTPHKDRIGDAVAKNDGKPLTFTEQFVLTHRKKGAKYDPSVRGPDAPVVDFLKPRLGTYWDAGVRLFGPDDTTWPGDWEERILAEIPNPAYKGNVPGFAYLSPAEVSAPRRRVRNAGINIGPPPTPNVAMKSDLQKWMEKQAALSNLLTKFLAKGGDTPLDPEMERLVKLNEDMQVECQMMKDQETLRVAEERARWEEDERVRAYYRGEGPSRYGGGSPVRDYRPTVESPPSMFEPMHISGAPQDARYMEETPEDEEEGTETDD